MITFDFGYTNGTKAGQEIINNDLALNKEFAFQTNVMPHQQAYEAQRYQLEGRIDPYRFRNERQILDLAYNLNPQRAAVEAKQLALGSAQTDLAQTIHNMNVPVVLNTQATKNADQLMQNQIAQQQRAATSPYVNTGTLYALFRRSTENNFNAQANANDQQALAIKHAVERTQLQKDQLALSQDMDAFNKLTQSIMTGGVTEENARAFSGHFPEYTLTADANGSPVVIGKGGRGWPLHVFQKFVADDYAHKSSVYNLQLQTQEQQEQARKASLDLFEKIAPTILKEAVSDNGMVDTSKVVMGSLSMINPEIVKYTRGNAQAAAQLQAQATSIIQRMPERITPDEARHLIATIVSQFNPYIPRLHPEAVLPTTTFIRGPNGKVVHDPLQTILNGGQ